MKQKTIYLLIGPKGSGKSFIGTLINKYFRIKFIRVEDWVKIVKGNREIDDEAYIKEVFQVVEKGVRQELLNHDSIVFESTGLSDYFDKMHSSLLADFKVKSIRIIAQDNLCLKRVRTRDQSIHIDVSDDQVKKINKQVKEKGILTDYSISNNDKTDLELIDELWKIIK